MQVALGSAHACALRDDGKVWCWGDNRFGQLGVEGAGPAPVFVGGLPEVVQVAAAGSASCALTRAGRVFCWGRGKVLGVKGERPWSPPQRPEPVAIGDLDGVQQLAIAEGEGCAVLTSGKVRCWSHAKRHDIAGLADVQEVSVNYRQKCARSRGGAVRCFERSATPDLVEPGVDDAKMLATYAADNRTCAVRRDGGVACWPQRWVARDFGGETEGDGAFDLPGVSAARSLTMGRSHTCIIDGDGRAACWGKDDYGQLGRGTRSFASFRPPAPAKLGAAKAVAAGLSQTCAILGDGAIACWGRAHGQLLGSEHRAFHPTPQRVPGVKGAVDVITGGQSTCALLASGALQCWGLGATQHMQEASFRQRGHEPMLVNGAFERAWPGRSTLVAQLRGGGHAHVRMARKRAAEDPPYEQAPLLGLPPLRMWAPGFRHDLALSESGDLITFDNTMFVFERNVKPTVVLSGLVALGVGSNRTCAAKKSGETICFDPGKIAKGKLPSTEVQTIAGLAPVTSVHVSGGDTAVLHRDGTVSVFDSRSSFGPTPRRIADVKGAKQIDIGALGDHGCAVLASGKVRCWGEPMALGLFAVTSVTNARDKSDVPSRLLAGVDDAQKVSFGGRHACILHASGGVSCWGDNTHDQVGSATPPFSATPVEVSAP